MTNIKLYNRPVSDLSMFDRDYTDLMEGFWDTNFATAFNPKVEITERENEYLVEVEAPGLTKDDIHVELKNGTLRLWGEKKTQKDEKSDRCTYSERTYGSFERAFGLPDNVDGEKVNAKYANGMLELTIPKTEKAKPKAIEVKIE